jgi:hypothetical protein
MRLSFSMIPLLFHLDGRFPNAIVTFLKRLSFLKGYRYFSTETVAFPMRLLRYFSNETFFSQQDRCFPTETATLLIRLICLITLMGRYQNETMGFLMRWKVTLVQMQWSFLNETVSFLNKMVTFPYGQFTRYSLHHPIERVTSH